MHAGIFLLFIRASEMPDVCPGTYSFGLSEPKNEQEKTCLQGVSLLALVPFLPTDASHQYKARIRRRLPGLRTMNEVLACLFPTRDSTNSDRSPGATATATRIYLVEPTSHLISAPALSLATWSTRNLSWFELVTPTVAPSSAAGGMNRPTRSRRAG